MSRRGERYGRVRYEKDDATFPGEGAFTIRGWRGVAWHVLGWETEATEDTEWDGIYVRTGRVVAVMVGDDSYFTFDPEDVEPLARKDYCGSCGQIGCAHDGYDREGDEA